MDDLEIRLRGLAQIADEKVAGGLGPRPDVRRRVRLRKAGAVLGSTAVIVAVATAGYAGVRIVRGGTSQSGEPNLLALAAQTTEAEGTARTSFEMEMRFEMFGRSETVTSRGDGEIDFEADRSFVHSDMTTGGLTTDLEIIQDGKTSYTKGLPGTEGWIRKELPSAVDVSGVLGGGQEFDVGSLFETLRGVSGDVVALGEDEIDGVSVTHYQAEQDADTLLQGVPDEMKGLIEDFRFEFEPLDVWIDRENRVRKLLFGLRFTADRDGMSFKGEMLFTTFYSDFGIPVDIDLPPAGEITDAPLSAVMENDFGADESSSDEEALFLYGETDDPRVIVNDDLRGICILDVPAWVSEADLLFEGSQVPLATIDEGRFQETPGGKIGCSIESVPSDLDEIEARADQLVLRLRGNGGVVHVQIVGAYRN